VQNREQVDPNGSSRKSANRAGARKRAILAPALCLRLLRQRQHYQTLL
jgi:hypothetical protein